jgi:hypothetical protein
MRVEALALCLPVVCLHWKAIDMLLVTLVSLSWALPTCHSDPKYPVIKCWTCCHFLPVAKGSCIPCPP